MGISRSGSAVHLGQVRSLSQARIPPEGTLKPVIKLLRKLCSSVSCEKKLVPKTDQTITEPDELWDELEKIAEQGYAVNDGELREGLRCIGAPVCVDGRAVGAISASSPKGRIQGERFEEEIPEIVKNTANVVEISTSYS